MSVADFLKDLPTKNRDNFTRINPGGTASNGQQEESSDSVPSQSRHRSKVYVPTKDYPTEQVIVTEKTNILLRYLHQQWDKKASLQKKREADASSEGTSTSGQDPANGVQRKRPRLENQTSGNNSGSHMENASASRGNGAAQPRHHHSGER